MSKCYHYSVYLRKTDFPAIIHGTAPECAKAMGLKDAQAFHEINCKSKKGLASKWEIYRDDEDD